MRYGTLHGSFQLTDLPGCSQVCVSHGAFVRERGKGHGSIDHKQHLKLAKQLGYNYILCTVEVSNDVQRLILRKNRWRFITEFYSNKTQHYVELWGRIV